jgi:hypothetical protein
VLSTGTDVTTYSDTVEISGGTAPELESPLSAIDDTTSKYLNFGTDGNQDAPFAGPVGFVVTPALGAEGSGTIVNAIRVYTANDATERDPVSVTLEGSNDGTSFSLISSNRLSLPDVRNASGLTLDPLTQAVQEVRFSNSRPFKSYRVMFNDVKNNTTANSVQVGELELLGTPAGNVAVVSVERAANGSITITSTQPGTLQSTTALRDAATVWTNEGAISGSISVSTTGTARFFRVSVQ